MNFTFNWLAIGLATLVPTILGFLWYNPKTIGSAWMKSIGKTEEELLEGFNMPLTMIISLVLSFLLACFVFIFITGMHASSGGSTATFGHGAMHGFFLGVFTMLPPMVTNSLFERKKWSNILINCSYWLITFALIGGIVDVWRVAA